MKRTSILVALLLLAAVPAQAGQTLPDSAREVEGCQVFNPGQPTCTYTATHVGETPVSGILGTGSWTVVIKVGKKKTVVKSPSTGEPTAVEMVIPEGAKVTMTALSPGSGGTVGHVD